MTHEHSFRTRMIGLDDWAGHDYISGMVCDCGQVLSQDEIEDILNGEAPIAVFLADPAPSPVEGSAKVSLLDIYDDLPEDEKKILATGVYRIGQWRRAERAKLVLPERVRKYYVDHYNLEVRSDKPLYEFVGFVCSSCNTWLDCGHSDDCPLNELMAPDFDYRAAAKLMEGG